VIEPELAVRDGRAAVAFYEAAFGARIIHRVGGTDAEPAIVAQLEVGDARFWVADEAPDHGTVAPGGRGGTTVRLLLVVADPDAVVARAAGAGATVHFPVGEEHGWRLGRIEDPAGHHWEIGRPLGTWPPDGA
jgi:PhnB protein